MWSPIGFERYRALFPATPALAAHDDATPAFIAQWEAMGSSLKRAVPPEADLTLVLVRGLFGSLIPRHFAAPLTRLRAAGWRVMIANTAAAGTMARNAALLRRDLECRAPDGRLAFLCHSKGGLDVLALLAASPELAARTAGIVLCQAPRAGCVVLESVLLGMHCDSAPVARRVSERVTRAAVALAGARAACLELTSPAIDAPIASLTPVAAKHRVIGVASWSSRPTAWLDSQHARLAAIRPGCAHDGLFYLEDLLWPGAKAVLLPEIDHAQPSVGGGGFDHARFWSALAGLLRE
jgi:hypothetical protein